MKKVALYTLAFVLFIGTTAFISNTSGLADQTEVSKPIPELQWFNKLEEAQAISQKTNKPIFAFFTGSDWCGWCHRLQANVFQKPAFKTWASENVVLLELDFPRRKQLPPEIAKQNQELQAFFKPRGYPTIWIFNMNKNLTSQAYEINAFGSLGYPSGSQPGKEEVTFIANADNILKSKPQ